MAFPCNVSVMHLFTSTLPLLASLLLVVHASPAPRGTSISWSKCAQGNNKTCSLQCATLEVPRDYTEPDFDETITLDLARLPASTQPSKGSIFINTGGPGVAQREALVGTEGLGYQLLTGGEYDIIGVDPRGTGQTLPFSCYNTSTELNIAYASVPYAWTASDTALGTIWGSKQIAAARCQLQLVETGELIGTAFVARDIMQVVDALGEDGMVRFLGFSYGTALGATLAAMFPDRVDKMVLDAVLNMDEYYAGRELEEVADSDAVWEEFFKGCMEAPESLCPLKRYSDSAEGLQTKIEELVKTIKYDPIPLGPIMPIHLVDYNKVKQAMFLGMYYPLLWPYLAAFFDGILTANVTAYVTNLEVIGGSFAAPPGFPAYHGGEALQGIRCSETAFRTDDVADLIPTLQEFEETSWVIGDSESTSIYMSCAAWQMKAKEIYSGGFESIQTRNPVLFVGNTFDPLTPLVSAKNLSSGFEGSGLLQHNGYGHASISQPSLCTARAIRAYFKDGTLPERGTVCEPDVPIFRPSDEQLEVVLAPLNGTTKRAIEERNEDWQLLEALGHLGRALFRSGHSI